MRHQNLLGGVALSLLLISCGSDADVAGSESVADQAAPLPAPASEAGAKTSDDSQITASVDDSAVAGRLIARTGYVNVLVEDLDQSMSEAAAIGTANGGFVANEQTTRDSSELTFKVVGDRFDAALTAFGELGEVDSQWVTTEDRTAQIVDLQARLDTAEASLARTRELFDAANGVDQLVTAENEIAQREQTVEVLRAQLRSQQESVSLATITVYLTIDPDSLPEEPVTIDEDLPTIRRAFDNGVAVLWFGLRVVGVTLAWLVPWIPVFALVIFIQRRLRAWFAKRPKKPGTQPTHETQAFGHGPLGAATPQPNPTPPPPVAASTVGETVAAPPPPADETES